MVHMKINEELRQVGRRLMRRRGEIPFKGSLLYWDERYRRGASSGSGSYGRLAEFKAEIVNGILADLGAVTVAEWGCGDGAQLQLLETASYIGIDASPTVVESCKRKYAHDLSRGFLTLEEARVIQPQADVSLSLDVVFHIVENDLYERYMRDLFQSARRAVIIYSSNEEDGEWDGSHVRHRCFTRWIDSEMPTWRLAEKVPNRYPFSADDPQNTSFCDFYVYRPA